MANDKPLCHYFRSSDTAGPQKVYLALKSLPVSAPMTASSNSLSVSSPTSSTSPSTVDRYGQESAFSPRSLNAQHLSSSQSSSNNNSSSNSSGPSSNSVSSSAAASSSSSSHRSIAELRQRHQASTSSTDSSSHNERSEEKRSDRRAHDPPPERVCRLCFSGEVTIETGRLFSPCRCSGSMRYIHLSCLNQWRRRSPKASSYFQCDQCHYRYNVRRTFVAELLQSHNTTAILTAVCLMTTVFVLGGAALYFSISHRFLEWLYTSINWTPEWFWARYLAPKLGASSLIIPMAYKMFVDTLFMGTAFVAVVGMCRYLLLQFGFMFFHRADMRLIAAPAIGLAQIYYLGGIGIRLLLFIGVAHSVITLFWVLQLSIKSVLQQFSEEILDISESEDLRRDVQAR